MKVFIALLGICTFFVLAVMSWVEFIEWLRLILMR